MIGPSRTPTLATLSSTNVQDLPFAATIGASNALIIAAGAFTQHENGGMTQKRFNTAFQPVLQKDVDTIPQDDIFSASLIEVSHACDSTTSSLVELATGCGVMFSLPA